MSQVLQIISAAGILTTVITLIVTRAVNSQLDAIKKLHQTKTENDFLLWTKIDKQGELTCLMAEKMHDAGIINGDLDKLKEQYKKADEDYEKHLKRLAAEVMRK